MRQYVYVGSLEHREHICESRAGVPVESVRDFEVWVGEVREVTVTYVVDVRGRLLVADRHSEHVVCARGEAVLGAGEMTWVWRGRWAVEHISNQSTGYCPEPASWGAVAGALKRAGVSFPEAWGFSCEFRRCEACGELALVKEGWFVCAHCEAELPREYNVQ